MKNFWVKKENILLVSLVAVYIATAAYGVYVAFDKVSTHYPDNHAMLLFVNSALGIFFAFVPLLILKLCKIRLSFLTQAVAALFFLMTGVGGEAFRLYYTSPWWDLMLHAYSGFMIAFLAFFFLATIVKDTDFKHKFAILLVSAIAISLAVALIWEVLEFTIDSMFGTDMQKYMPSERRRDFGYRHALMDTMFDMVCGLTGAFAFGILAIILRNTKFLELPFIEKCE
jgi:hypothetical protein